MIFLLLLLLFAGSLAPASAAAAQGQPGGKYIPIAAGRGPRVSLDVRGIDIRTVLSVLSDNTGVTFTLAPGVQGAVSHKQRDLALEDMLDAILPPLTARWQKLSSTHYLIEPALDQATGVSLRYAPRGWDSHGLQATYFNDRVCELPDGTFSALLAVLPAGAVKRTDPRIAFSWKQHSPAKGISPAHWSARWKGRLWIPQDDTYTFTFEPLQGAALLMLDGKLVLDGWHTSAPPTGLPIKLKRGWHAAVIEYHQASATGGLCLRWQAPWLQREAVPIYRGEKTRTEKAP